MTDNHAIMVMLMVIVLVMALQNVGIATEKQLSVGLAEVNQAISKQCGNDHP